MKLRFHKIAPEGKSVIYPKDDDDSGQIIPLNIIVLPSQRKNKEEE
ncbi:MAG: hypothetical protein KAR39_01600 [Thermoplasmata archaeon]|nr:hypothetical protein [Thermoplasmata archaeon]